jgi:hypothetical protein
VLLSHLLHPNRAGKRRRGSRVTTSASHLHPTEGHRKRLREAFGNTMSDEFVDVILGKLVEALRPSIRTTEKNYEIRPTGARCIADW